MGIASLLPSSLHTGLQKFVETPVGRFLAIQVAGCHLWVNPPPSYDLSVKGVEREGSRLDIAPGDEFVHHRDGIPVERGGYRLKIATELAERRGTGTAKAPYDFVVDTNGRPVFNHEDNRFSNRLLDPTSGMGSGALGIFFLSLPTTIPLSPLLLGLAAYYRLLENHVWHHSRGQHAVLKALEGQIDAEAYDDLREAFENDFRWEKKFTAPLDWAGAKKVLEEACFRWWQVPTPGWGLAADRFIGLWEDKDGDVLATVSTYDGIVTAMNVLGRNVSPKDALHIFSTISPHFVGVERWTENLAGRGEREQRVINWVLNPDQEKLIRNVDATTRREGYGYLWRDVQTAVHVVDHFAVQNGGREISHRFTLHADGSITAGSVHQSVAGLTETAKICYAESVLNDSPFYSALRRDAKPEGKIAFTESLILSALELIGFGRQRYDERWQEDVAEAQKEGERIFTPIFPWIHRVATRYPAIFDKYKLVAKDEATGDLTFEFDEGKNPARSPRRTDAPQ